MSDARAEKSGHAGAISIHAVLDGADLHFSLMTKYTNAFPTEPPTSPFPSNRLSQDSHLAASCHVPACCARVLLRYLDWGACSRTSPDLQAATYMAIASTSFHFRGPDDAHYTANRRDCAAWSRPWPRPWRTRFAVSEMSRCFDGRAHRNTRGNLQGLPRVAA
jgi:hypothetical protein